ncbi:glycoside hydrolase superfamily [Amylocystis lapponica]|nr:glycoside hydrolase superfamily [Amylocystis lapponica]
MHKLSGFLKHHLNPQPGQASVPTDDTPFPSEADFYRYRKQRGVNLGSWFVLERWIAEAPFRLAKAPAQSDLDVARGEQAKEVLESHWDTWITEKDWAWIAELNTVRIPIGYYHVCGANPSVLPGTDFANLEHVFHGAWRRITNALATANRHGLGVLIDLHAAPGKQNADAHSGTSAPDTGFFTPRLMQHTTHVLATLLSHLSDFARAHDPPLHNLVGIELLNEPAPGPHGPALEQWYRDTFRALRAVDPSIPLYIGDAWMTDHHAEFLGATAVPFAVLDHHLYRCFTAGDISTPVAKHTWALTDDSQWAPQMFSRVSQKLDGAGCALVVAEWSCGLNPGSLVGARDEDQARREYVQAQLRLYDRFCAGWFFWTYKKEYGGDKGWSLRDAVAAGVFPDWVGLHAKTPITDDPERQARREAAKNKALGEWSDTIVHTRGTRTGSGYNSVFRRAHILLVTIPRAL